MSASASSKTAADEHGHHGLARDLTLFDAINLVIGTIIGSGIFLVPGRDRPGRPHVGLDARRLGDRRRPDDARRAVARGARRRDARGGRDLHVHQPRLRATLGLPLRLDALHRRDLGLDRDARGRVPDLPRRLRSADPDHHEDRRTRRDRAPDVDQHRRRQERRAGRKLPDRRQGRRPDRDGRRHLPPARAHRSRGGRRGAAPVRPGSARRGRRRARRGPLGLRGMARRDLRRRRDARPPEELSAGHRRRRRHRDRDLHRGQPRLPQGPDARPRSPARIASR